RQAIGSIGRSLLQHRQALMPRAEPAISRGSFGNDAGRESKATAWRSQPSCLSRGIWSEADDSSLRSYHDPGMNRKALLNGGQSRSDIGTHLRPRGPTYSARGLIRRLLANCSRTCAVQPEIRLQAKIGVNKSVGMPSV